MNAFQHAVCQPAGFPDCRRLPAVQDGGGVRGCWMACRLQIPLPSRIRRREFDATPLVALRREVDDMAIRFDRVLGVHEDAMRLRAQRTEVIAA
ncbi:MAG: hypothetical protein U1F75_17355, partial [Plasticicumulans sp.]